MTERPSLALVSANPVGRVSVRKPKAKPTPASVKRLQERARRDAKALIQDLVANMEALAAQAREVADLGESAPVGVREISPRIASDLENNAKSILRLIGGR